MTGITDYRAVSPLSEFVDWGWAVVTDPDEGIDAIAPTEEEARVCIARFEAGLDDPEDSECLCYPVILWRDHREDEQARQITRSQIDSLGICERVAKSWVRSIRTGWSDDVRKMTEQFDAAGRLAAELLEAISHATGQRLSTDPTPESVAAAKGALARFATVDMSGECR